MLAFKDKKSTVMPNLFRHPTGYSRLQGLRPACGRLSDRILCMWDAETSSA